MEISGKFQLFCGKSLFLLRASSGMENILNGLIYSMFNNCNWDFPGVRYFAQLSIIEMKADKNFLLIKIHSMNATEWKKKLTLKSGNLGIRFFVRFECVK